MHIPLKFVKTFLSAVNVLIISCTFKSLLFTFYKLFRSDFYTWTTLHFILQEYSKYRKIIHFHALQMDVLWGLGFCAIFSGDKSKVDCFHIRFFAFHRIGAFRCLQTSTALPQLCNSSWVSAETSWRKAQCIFALLCTAKNIISKYRKILKIIPSVCLTS